MFIRSSPSAVRLATAVTREVPRKALAELL